jgi:hypothetical protein
MSPRVPFSSREPIDIGLCDKSRQICNGRWFNPHDVTVVIRLAEKAEVDEMWSFVGKQHEPDGAGM